MIFNQIFVFLLIVLLVIHTTALDQAIHPDSFHQSVLGDDKTWLIEFYSEMCGSCKEFAPTWDKVANSMKSIATAKINVDTKDGAKLASSLGVFDEGIPNIRLFHKKAPNSGVSIMGGEEMTFKAIMQKLKRLTAGLVKGNDGYFQKEL